MQIDSASANSKGLYAYNYHDNTLNQISNVPRYIDITEHMGRSKMSTMIGETIIGKVFNDNMRDFKSEGDMEPIMNICSIITKVLIILKELDVK